MDEINNYVNINMYIKLEKQKQNTTKISKSNRKIIETGQNEREIFVSFLVFSLY
jgi:hypothetical protein